MNQTKATIYLQRAYKIISSLCENNTNKNCLKRIIQLEKAQRLLQQADNILLNDFMVENISRLKKEQDKVGTIQEITKAYKLSHI